MSATTIDLLREEMPGLDLSNTGELAPETLGVARPRAA